MYKLVKVPLLLREIEEIEIERERKRERESHAFSPQPILPAEEVIAHTHNVRRASNTLRTHAVSLQREPTSVSTCPQ